MFIYKDKNQGNVLAHAWGLMSHSSGYRNRAIGSEYEKWIALVARDLVCLVKSENKEDAPVIGMFGHGSVNFIVENILRTNLRPLQPLEWASGDERDVVIYDVLAPWGKGSDILKETANYFKDARTVRQFYNIGMANHSVTFVKGEASQVNE